MIRISLLSIVLLAAQPLPGGARSPGAQQSRAPDLFSDPARKPGSAIETRHLSLTVTASPSTAAPGGRVTLAVDIEPKPGMHVYSPEQKDVIPVALELVPDTHLRAGARRLPPAERYFFPPLNETQRVYSKRFRIEQDVRILDTPAIRRRADAGDRSLTVRGTVRYQACDDAVCYLPEAVPVSWTLTLAAPGQ